MSARRTAPHPLPQVPRLNSLVLTRRTPTVLVQHDCFALTVHATADISILAATAKTVDFRSRVPKCLTLRLLCSAASFSFTQRDPLSEVSPAKLCKLHLYHVDTPCLWYGLNGHLDDCRFCMQAATCPRYTLTFVISRNFVDPTRTVLPAVEHYFAFIHTNGKSHRSVKGTLISQTNEGTPPTTCRSKPARIADSVSARLSR